ncbi:MAG: LytR C-terminal domain-containing protein [Gemmatimonadota bacterium]
MLRRPRLEAAALIAASVICAAFVASFVLGLRNTQRAAASPPAPAAAPAVQEAEGTVEVLNGSGRSGMARQVTARLREAGFDVVFFGNAPASAGDSSVVLDRTGDDAVARAAGRALGIDRVRTERDTTLYLDATIILGRDWAPEEDEAAPRPGFRTRALDWLRPGR